MTEEKESETEGERNFKFWKIEDERKGDEAKAVFGKEIAITKL